METALAEVIKQVLMKWFYDPNLHNIMAYELTMKYSMNEIDPNKLSVYVGRKFGKLTVQYVIGNSGSKQRAMCICECENQKETSIASLVNGMTKSCGCLKRGGKSSKQDAIT